MYSVGSDAVWHSLPGVVAAYQSIAAPDPLAARQNVAYRGARFGVYTAVPGVAPTWKASTGWTFAGSQYLNTGIIPQKPSSMVMRVVKMSGTDRFSGIYESYNHFHVCPRYGSAYRDYGHGNHGYVTTFAVTSGVMAVAGNKGYLNGSLDTLITDREWTTTYAIYIGGTSGTYSSRLIGDVPVTLIVSRELSAAEVWLASHQMAYCEQNPDWNAWARRRMYFYAPQATATFNPAWARNANSVIQVTP